MTRSEFIEGVDWFDELISFCRDYNLDACSDILHEDDLDEKVCDDIREALSHEYWYDIRRYLNSLETGWSWYRDDGYLDYVGLDEDSFQDYKDAALEEADGLDIWEPEDDEVDDESESAQTEPGSTEEDDMVADEPISIAELMTQCNSQFKAILLCNQEKKAESTRNFEDEYEFDRIPW